MTSSNIALELELHWHKIIIGCMKYVAKSKKKGIRIKSGNIISGSIIPEISNSKRIKSGMHKNRNA